MFAMIWMEKCFWQTLIKQIWQSHNLITPRFFSFWTAWKLMQYRDKMAIIKWGLRVWPILWSELLNEVSLERHWFGLIQEAELELSVGDLESTSNRLFIRILLLLGEMVNLPQNQPMHKMTEMHWLMSIASWLFGSWPFLPATWHLRLSS